MTDTPTRQNLAEPALPSRQEAAARLVAEDDLTNEQIAARVGVKRQTLDLWKKRSDFIARVNEHKERFRDAALTEGFADKRARLTALNTVATALLQQLGDSQYQHVTFVAEDGAHIYGFDVPRLKEFRGTLDDMAKEMGDRRTGIDARHTITDHRKQVAAIAAALDLPPDVAAELAADADRLIEQRATR